MLDTLFDMLTSDIMATSLRLLIIRAFDRLTDTHCGLLHFLGETPGQSGVSGYQKLLDAVAGKKQVKK